MSSKSSYPKFSWYFQRQRLLGGAKIKCSCAFQGRGGHTTLLASLQKSKKFDHTNQCSHQNMDERLRSFEWIHAITENWLCWRNVEWVLEPLMSSNYRSYCITFVMRNTGLGPRDDNLCLYTVPVDTVDYCCKDTTTDTGKLTLMNSTMEQWSHAINLGAHCESVSEKDKFEW